MNRSCFEVRKFFDIIFCLEARVQWLKQVAIEDILQCFGSTGSHIVLITMREHSEIVQVVV